MSEPTKASCIYVITVFVLECIGFRSKPVSGMENHTVAYKHRKKWEQDCRSFIQNLCLTAWKQKNKKHCLKVKYSRFKIVGMLLNTSTQKVSVYERKHEVISRTLYKHV